MTHDTPRYLPLATKLAKDAGVIIRKHFSLTTAKQWKADHSPVTAGDIAVNKMVVEKIKAEFPEHDIIGEEESDTTGKAEFTWLCDPIDGTIPFSAGIPTFMFSLALYQNGEPLLGVAYDVIADRLYTAEVGKGAFVNDTPLKLESSGLETGDIVCFITDHMPKFDINSVFGTLAEREIRVLQIHSFVYVMCMIAADKVKAAIIPQAYPWDRAAAVIILREAGGISTNINSEPVDWLTRESREFHIAGNPTSQKELLSLLKVFNTKEDT